MSAQDKSIDLATSHAIYTQRLAGGLSNEFKPYIEQLKKEISFRLNSSDVTQFQQARLNALIKSIEKAEQKVYTAYNKQLIEQLELFGVDEGQWEVKSIDDVIESDLTVAVASPDKIIATINAQPLIFPDSNKTILLDPFVKEWSDKEIKRVSDIIRTGVIMGENTNTIARKITGKGGTLDKQTFAANKAMVRTATNHAAIAAKESVFKQNDDIVIGYEWVSTLDSRTTPQCRSLDGKVFLNKSKGFKPVPPIHINCRSTTSPVLNQRYALDDKKETVTAKGADGKQQVQASTTYYSFLKRQPKAFQDDVLGPTRGKLLRNGGLTADEFASLTVDQKFRPLTLAEMQKKKPDAFEQANID